jgi:hypothetical protein
MFDTEEYHGWPPAAGQMHVLGERKPKTPENHRCYYCGELGHFNSKCPVPHLKCQSEGRCIVPLGHAAFMEACAYGGRTSGNHPAHKKRKRQSTPLFSLEPTPTPSPTIRTATELPPADSLLFSTNPTPDAVIASFAPSPYQGPAPAPSLWGDAPFGTTWEEFHRRNPSPCIFDYGRGGDDPLYLGGHHIPDTSDPVPYRDLSYTLPRNAGVENLLLYAEEDLPGATHYHDDDPFEPTATMVDSYRRMSVRDLGVSD